MSHLETVLDQSPQWMLDLLPNDLIKAIRGEITQPTCAGRKSSIDADNINDVAFYVNKTKGKKSCFSRNLKGTELKPYEYAVENRKWKSITYLCGARRPKELLNCFKKGIDDAPKWYKYFFLMIYNSGYSAIPEKYFYALIYDCPVPMACIHMLIHDYGKINEPQPGRTTHIKEKDIELWKNITNESVKRELLELFLREKIYLDIKDCIREEGNMEYILLVFGWLTVCEDTIANGRIEEFKTFVDARKECFNHLNNFNMIRPKFKGLYEHAFARTCRYYDDTDVGDVNSHAVWLASKGYYDELKFIIDHGYVISSQCEIRCFQTLNKQMISLCKDKVSPVDWLLLNDIATCRKVVKMGYHPTVKAISELYNTVKKYSYTKNFEVITYANPSEPLDALKYPIANYHTELVQPFLKKYRSRLNDVRASSWNITNLTYFSSFCELCEILDVQKEQYVYKLFENTMEKLIEDPERQIIRNLAMSLLKGWKQDVCDCRYLKCAFKMNDIELAGELVKAGASPSRIPDWEDDVSIAMFNVITNLIQRRITEGS